MTNDQGSSKSQIAIDKSKLVLGHSLDIGHWTLVIPHMLLARVEGTVVATRKHPSLEGWRLVVCQPISQTGDAEGAPQVAIDAYGAGMHQRVVISSDGFAARQAVKDPKSPARWMIVAIVDEKAPGVPV